MDNKQPIKLRLKKDTQHWFEAYGTLKGARYPEVDFLFLCQLRCLLLLCLVDVAVGTYDSSEHPQLFTFDFLEYEKKQLYLGHLRETFDYVAVWESENN